jgi:DNA-binding MurR/RpiR family transcriptional regulator
MPRYPAATVRLLDVLTRLGYRVLLVSDDAMPPVPGRPPAWHLAVPVGSELTFDSHPAVLAVLGVLLDAMCNAAPIDAEGRLERLDVIADEVDTYWRP